MLVDGRIRKRKKIYTDPDPGSPKTHGSGSVTLFSISEGIILDPNFLPIQDPGSGSRGEAPDSASATLSTTLVKLTGSGRDLSEGLGAEAQHVRPHPPHQRTEHLLQQEGRQAGPLVVHFNRRFDL